MTRTRRLYNYIRTVVLYSGNVKEKKKHCVVEMKSILIIWVRYYTGT